MGVGFERAPKPIFFSTPAEFVEEKLYAERFILRLRLAKKFMAVFCYHSIILYDEFGCLFDRNKWITDLKAEEKFIRNRSLVIGFLFM